MMQSLAKKQIKFDARFAWLVLVITAFTLVGCYESSYDEAVDRFNANNPPPPVTPPPPPPTGSFGPNFSEIQTAVLTPTCATSGCHAGANPAATLNLDATNSYMMLVGVASSQDGNVQRVNPTDPNNSYLIQKMEGTASSGGVMPPSGSIPQIDIDTIRQWISAGAIDDRVVSASPIRVSSLSVTPNSTVTAAPTAITAGFDRELDASSINVNTFILEGSNNDGVFGDGDDIMITAASITVPAANPQSAVFDLTGVALADDTYRVRLLGDGASIVMDLDANALDGEFSGAFPSGDGTAGGDFAAEFTIATPQALLRVASLSITPNSTLTAAPTSITAGFDRDLDAATVNANSFILEASNNDGVFDDGDDMMITAASITLQGGNPRNAVFDLTGVALADDTYRIRLLGNGGSVIADTVGNVLDGEFSGAFPSGNGTAGGDFASQFTISTPIVLGPTLDQIQAVVFTPDCATSGCHDNTTQAAGLSLADADTSFLELVGQFSNQNGQSNVMLVAPNDPDASYLIRKLENTAGITGTQMPQMRPALSQADIDQIRLWITNGALRN